MITDKMKSYAKIGIMTSLFVLLVRIILPFFRQAKGVKI